MEITDPADPAPYWLVCTRHPDELARRADRAESSRSPGWVGSGHGIRWRIEGLDRLLARRPRSAPPRVAKKALDKTWKVATGKKPPENPADPDVDVWEAVAWAVVSGAVVGLARMLAQRRAASYYAQSTGHLPPDLQTDDQEA